MKTVKVLTALTFAGLMTTPFLAQAATVKSTPTATAKLPGIVGGSAYAEYSDAKNANGTTTTSGPVALATGSCSTASQTNLNTVQNTNVRGLGTTGTARDTVTSTYASGSESVVSTARIQNANFLGGLIKAQSIVAQATLKATKTGVTSNFNGTKISGLTINGQTVSPTQNKTYSLPGVGSVTFDRTSVTNSSARSTAGVDAMVIVVKQTNKSLKLSAGSRMIIGQAIGDFRPIPGQFVATASAYGYKASTSNGPVSTQSGPIANVASSCTGGKATRTLNQTSATDASLGTIVDTASSNLTATGSSAHGQSRVTGGNVLGGMIKASSITATANASFSGSSGKGGASTTYSGLIINGAAVNSPKPNTHENLPGIGYVVLNAQTHRSSNSQFDQTVSGMVIHVQDKNKYGLAVGSTIVVAHAEALAKKTLLTP